MIRKIIISLCLTVLSCVVCSAVPYRAVIDSLDVAADSVSVDSLDVKDSTAAKDTVKKVRDKGFDVSPLLNGTRYKAPAHTELLLQYIHWSESQHNQGHDSRLWIWPYCRRRDR